MRAKLYKLTIRRQRDLVKRTGALKTEHPGADATEKLQKQRRTVVAEGRGWREWGDVNQRVQIFSYKMNKFQGPNVQYGNYS